MAHTAALPLFPALPERSRAASSNDSAAMRCWSSNSPWIPRVLDTWQSLLTERFKGNVLVEKKQTPTQRKREFNATEISAHETVREAIFIYRPVLWNTPVNIDIEDRFALFSYICVLLFLEKMKINDDSEKRNILQDARVLTQETFCALYKDDVKRAEARKSGIYEKLAQGEANSIERLISQAREGFLDAEAHRKCLKDKYAFKVMLNPFLSLTLVLIVILFGMVKTSSPSTDSVLSKVTVTLDRMAPAGDMTINDNTLRSTDILNVTSLTYSYDGNKRKANQAGTDAQTFGYDDADRLTGWTSTDNTSKIWDLNPVGDWKTLTTTNGTGLLACYFPGDGFSGAPVYRVDKTLSFVWATIPVSDDSFPADGFSVRWQGRIATRFDEPMTLIVTSDDGIRAWLDGNLVNNDWNLHGANEDRCVSRAGRFSEAGGILPPLVGVPAGWNMRPRIKNHLDEDGAIIPPSVGVPTGCHNRLPRCSGTISSRVEAQPCRGPP